ncbi:Hypothetical_protein [Hexamita inflata]|uniref:Hypothetical_protein n=1 Tax=Hexamita inflata TaxID=28002 RepID=A0AA86R1E6_9EUKA|nr:Hypothetical protein HINF_LOCUS52826 [Hexamita inflata]
MNSQFKSKILKSQQLSLQPYTPLKKISSTPPLVNQLSSLQHLINTCLAESDVFVQKFHSILQTERQKKNPQIHKYEIRLNQELEFRTTVQNAKSAEEIDQVKAKRTFWDQTVLLTKEEHEEKVKHINERIERETVKEEPKEKINENDQKERLNNVKQIVEQLQNKINEHKKEQMALKQKINNEEKQNQLEIEQQITQYTKENQTLTKYCSNNLVKEITEYKKLLQKMQENKSTIDQLERATVSTIRQISQCDLITRIVPIKTNATPLEYQIKQLSNEIQQFQVLLNDAHQYQKLIQNPFLQLSDKLIEITNLLVAISKEIETAQQLREISSFFDSLQGQIIIICTDDRDTSMIEKLKYQMLEQIRSKAEKQLFEKISSQVQGAHNMREIVNIVSEVM